MGPVPRRSPAGDYTPDSGRSTAVAGHSSLAELLPPLQGDGVRRRMNRGLWRRI